MKNIFKIELYKIKSYTGFWIITGIIFGLFLITAVSSGLFEQFLKMIIKDDIGEIGIKKIFYFPQVWNTFTWIAKFFNRMLALIVIILIGNEFSYRTFKQHLIDGLNRNQLIMGKLFIIVLLSFVFVFITFTLSLSFGLTTTENFEFADIFKNSHFILMSFIQTLAFLSFAMLIVLLFKNTALSIIIYIAYFIFEWLFRGILLIMKAGKAIHFFPMKVFSNLTPAYVQENLPEALQNQDQINNPFAADTIDFQYTIIFAVIYLFLFIGLSFLIVRKRNFN